MKQKVSFKSPDLDGLGFCFFGGGGRMILKAIVEIISFFDKMYDIMDEAEKRDFVTQLIQKVEVYEERQPNGQWLKAIEFKLPIIEHDMKLVSSICEELTVLNFGSVLCQGKTDDVLNNPEVIKAYIGG